MCLIPRKLCDLLWPHTISFVSRLVVFMVCYCKDNGHTVKSVKTYRQYIPLPINVLYINVICIYFMFIVWLVWFLLKLVWALDLARKSKVGFPLITSGFGKVKVPQPVGSKSKSSFVHLSENKNTCLRGDNLLWFWDFPF